MDVGALNSQDQLMEKTVLKDMDEINMNQMKNDYITEIFGAQKKLFISSSALNLFNLEMMKMK